MFYNKLNIKAMSLLISVTIVILAIAFNMGMFLVQAYAVVADYGDIANCKVVRVYDGDTLYVDIPNTHVLFGKSIPIRVAHIDTPELKGKCPSEVVAANTAKNLVKKLLPAGSIITLKHVRRDNYFRVLAEVDINGGDLGTVLVNAGLARTYEGVGLKPKWCSDKPQ